MLGSETLVYAGNARQKVGEVTSYFRTPGMSLLDWQNNSDCGRAGRAGGHNPPPFGLGAEPANTGTPPLPVGCSHIHPETACREVRERQWRSAAPVSAAPATKPAETLGFCRFSFCMCCMGMGFVLVRTPGFLIWFYPFSTVPIPSSTQNAPGFAFFGFFRVRFSLFCWFTGAKFLVLFLCRLPFAGYKLKSLVIPPNRDVSFLT